MTSIFFSPRGTTKKTARAILGHQEKVLERFRKELDHIDDLLNGDA